MQNNKFDLLIKLIIPAVLLIFWALSNLFNRETPKPAGRDRISPLGPRPGTPATTPQARYQQAKDDVIIIRSETNRPPARTTQAQRRGSIRPRPGQTPPPRTAEPAPSRNRDYVGEKVNADVNQSLSRTMSIRPLSETVSASQAIASSPTPSAATATTLTIGVILPTSSDDLRRILTNPARLREAFLLNEVLQPPLAMRGRTGQR